MPQMPEAAGRCGLRMMSYSRAGYGASTRHAGRSVADVVTDVDQVLDHLGIDRCVTGGWSGGGRTPWRWRPCNPSARPVAW